jgi:hypothetical protein
MTAAPRSRMCPFILSLLEFANHLLKSFFLAHVVGEVVPRALRMTVSTISLTMASSRLLSSVLAINVVAPSSARKDSRRRLT